VSPCSRLEAQHHVAAIKTVLASIMNAATRCWAVDHVAVSMIGAPTPRCRDHDRAHNTVSPCPKVANNVTACL
jgi:hypothetical protein